MAFGDGLKSIGEKLATSTGGKSLFLLPKKIEPTYTWEQYKKWVTDKAKEGKALWYRGQANSTWTLKTTFHREADKTGMTMPEYLALVGGELHYQLSSRLNERIRLEDQFEYPAYLALLRNHGFPTPILDWTLSPYVAIYFAFRECDAEKPKCRQVRVYIFDCDSWRKTYSQEYNLSALRPYVRELRPYAKWNPRQVVQNTVYTVTNMSDMQGHIVKHNTPTLSFLYHYDLSADIKADVMRELNLMGINEMTLFPDLDGLCREMKQKYF